MQNIFDFQKMRETENTRDMKLQKFKTATTKIKIKCNVHKSDENN